MNKMQLLNMNGVTREITDGTIKTDDNKTLDVSKKYYYRTWIHHLDKVKPSTDGMDYENVTKLLVQRLVDDFHFDIRYKNAWFDGKSKNVNKTEYSKIIKYTDDCYAEYGFKSLLMYGLESWGTGKTYTINAIANAWFFNPRTKITMNGYGEVTVEYCGPSYRQIREEDLLLRITNSYKQDATESELNVFESLDKYDILAIDDVGKYQPSNLEFYRRVMFQIIDTRYNTGKGIILSTNFKKADLLKLYGIAIVDRLNEMASDYQIEFKGDSNRVK